MPTNNRRPRQPNPNQQRSRDNTRGNQQPASPEDQELLATPTQLDFVNNTDPRHALDARRDFANSIRTTNDALLRDYQAGRTSGNRHVHPEGPGLDAYNLAARLAHRHRGNTHIPFDVMTIGIANDIVSTYPNPRELVAEAMRELGMISLGQQQRTGNAIDLELEREFLDRSLKVIYGHRYDTFLRQEQEAQAQRREQVRQQGLAAQIERAQSYLGKELLDEDERSALLEAKMRIVARNNEEMRRAEHKNERSDNRNHRLRIHADDAQENARYRKQQLDDSTWVTRWVRKRISARANKRASKATATYTKHTNTRNARITRATENAAHRHERYAKRISELSEKRIRAVENKTTRNLRRKQKQDDLRRQGYGYLEARRRSAEMSEEDKKYIRGVAIMLIQEEMRRNHQYSGRLDSDRYP